MKRFTRLLIALLLVFSMCFLASCDDTPDDPNNLENGIQGPVVDY